MTVAMHRKHNASATKPTFFFPFTSNMLALKHNNVSVAILTAKLIGSAINIVGPFWNEKTIGKSVFCE